MQTLLQLLETAVVPQSYSSKHYVPVKKEKKEIAGRRFGRLVVIGEYVDSKTKVKCKCDCGNVHFVKYSNLEHGGTISCGCFKKDTQSSKVASERSSRNVRNHANVGIDIRPKLASGKELRKMYRKILTSS